jgi:hypothetical protein
MSLIDATPEFESLGIEVSAEDVPALVRGGAVIFAAGYGDGEDGFDALDEGDLWAFEGPDADPALVAEWGPFRDAV